MQSKAQNQPNEQEWQTSNNAPKRRRNRNRKPNNQGQTDNSNKFEETKTNAPQNNQRPNTAPNSGVKNNATNNQTQVYQKKEPAYVHKSSNEPGFVGTPKEWFSGKLINALSFLQTRNTEAKLALIYLKKITITISVHTHIFTFTKRCSKTL